MRNSDFDQLERTFGIVMPEVLDYTTNLLAMDAQPPLVTTSNAGIPAWLANYIDPDFVQILVTPSKAAQILGEAKKGDWTTLTATFPVIESTGEVSSYGDYNENGSVSANADFPQRQSYHYQTMTQWGERQLEMSALAKIDYVARVNIASAIVLDKFQNNTYFFGVAGLQNYGLLNDPRLSPSLAPGVKAFNAGASGPWITNGAVTATANEIYTDIQTLFNELVLQSGGLIEMDTKMTLAMAPSSSVALTTTNTYNVNVTDMLKKNFPAMRVDTAVQYQNAAGGNLVQLIADAVEGQKTGYCAFTEKLRAHGIVRETSSFKQKKSQGSWGSVIFQPFAIASMLGV
ncbi:hypothetical protein R75461_07778 [Paraburkholderia nemoris]|uniref:DUF2184 domain-containing protein n=1 Tax=Paraburkholderia nemoris TaxID=2793076 RepID=UPI0019098D8F|nr:MULTISPECIES: DUF2184 domain-containing protein [Paraburkholderia]MBK3786523.1 DUF2184 domain-containing protein [Paraburkholderia aspalathi]CAE6857195.1 hypothetical protein R75461_07778 [Paraburkholderia nemoris]